MDVRDLRVGDELHGPDGELLWTVDREPHVIVREGVEFLRIRVRNPSGRVGRLTFDTFARVEVTQP